MATRAFLVLAASCEFLSFFYRFWLFCKFDKRQMKRQDAQRTFVVCLIASTYRLSCSPAAKMVLLQRS